MNKINSFSKLIEKTVFSLFLLSSTYIVNAGEIDCGILKNPYGPFDYTNPDHVRLKLPVVEGHHFNTNVQNLIRGQEGFLWGDLDYVLRAFPNHHRALDTMARYQLKNPDDATNIPELRSIECYFDRAIRFKPNDAVIYFVYGIYLQRKGDLALSKKKYNDAIRFGLKSSELYYNYGLLLFELKEFEESKIYAQKALELDYPIMGLVNKLKSINKW